MDQKTPETTVAIPEKWREPIRQLIREELKAMSAQGAIVPELTERPPTRPKKSKGRGYAGKKRVLPGSNVDEKLFELFNEFRRQHRLSASEAMETILWVFFNRPHLSYESKPDEKSKSRIAPSDIDRA
jgi:hypothetical protein